MDGARACTRGILKLIGNAANATKGRRMEGCDDIIGSKFTLASSSPGRWFFVSKLKSEGDSACEKKRAVTSKKADSPFQSGRVSRKHARPPGRKTYTRPATPPISPDQLGESCIRMDRVPGNKPQIEKRTPGSRKTVRTAETTGRPGAIPGQRDEPGSVGQWNDGRRRKEIKPTRSQR